MKLPASSRKSFHASHQPFDTIRSCAIIQRALVVVLQGFQRDLLDLGGRPPLRFFRRACNCLKYAGHRLAISFPPFRPSFTAAGSFFLGKIQRVINLLTVLCSRSIRDKHRVLFIASFYRHRENSESMLRFRSGAPPSANAPNRQPRPPERSSPRGA